MQDVSRVTEIYLVPIYSEKKLSMQHDKYSELVPNLLFIYFLHQWCLWRLLFYKTQSSHHNYYEHVFGLIDKKTNVLFEWKV